MGGQVDTDRRIPAVGIAIGSRSVSEFEIAGRLTSRSEFAPIDYDTDPDSDTDPEGSLGNPSCRGCCRSLGYQLPFDLLRR
jgi:hypothetical protein